MPSKGLIQRMRHYGTYSSLALIALPVYLWLYPPAWVSQESRPVSPFTVAVIGGDVLDDQALRGKVVLVNFWATWCPFCRHEMPAMQAFYRDQAARGFEILAVSIEDEAAPVARFMHTADYGFPAALTNPSIARAFGHIDRVPASFILDRHGVIRYRIMGQVTGARLRRLIEPLLDERSASREDVRLGPAHFSHPDDQRRHEEST